MSAKAILRGMKQFLVVIVCAFMLVFAAAAQDQVVVKIYPMHATQPEALVQALKDIFGDKVKITYYKPGNQLIVVGPASEQDAVLALTKELNVPGRNVRIDVDFIGAGETSDSEASIGGSGSVIIDKSGTSYNVKLNPKLTHQTGTQTDNTRQSILVQSGREATIFVGKEVPYSQWLYDVARDWGYIRQEFTMKPIGSHLVVQPQVGGDGKLVTVTLTPELSALDEGSGALQQIRYTKVATQVTVADGETISIGGAGKDKDFYSKFLIGMSKSGEKKSLDIRLTVHIQDPAGQPVE